MQATSYRPDPRYALEHVTDLIALPGMSRLPTQSLPVVSNTDVSCSRST